MHGWAYIDQSLPNIHDLCMDGHILINIYQSMHKSKNIHKDNTIPNYPIERPDELQKHKSFLVFM